jgi:hypothetical protein
MLRVALITQDDARTAFRDPAHCHRGNGLLARFAVLMVPSALFERKSLRVVISALVQDEEAVTPGLWMPSAATGNLDRLLYWRIALMSGGNERC